LYLFYFPFISLPVRCNPQSVHKAITRLLAHFSPLLLSDWRLAYLHVRRLLSFTGR